MTHYGPLLTQEYYDKLEADHQYLNRLHRHMDQTESWNGGDICEDLAEHFERTGRHITTETEREQARLDHVGRITDQVGATIRAYDAMVRSNGAESVVAVAFEADEVSEYGVFGEVLDVAAGLGFDITDNEFADALARSSVDYKRILRTEILEKLEG